MWLPLTSGSRRVWWRGPGITRCKLGHLQSQFLYRHFAGLAVAVFIQIFPDRTPPFSFGVVLRNSVVKLTGDERLHDLLSSGFLCFSFFYASSAMINVSDWLGWMFMCCVVLSVVKQIVSRETRGFRETSWLKGVAGRRPYFARLVFLHLNDSEAVVLSWKTCKVIL